MHSGRNAVENYSAQELLVKTALEAIYRGSFRKERIKGEKTAVIAHVRRDLTIPFASETHIVLTADTDKKANVLPRCFAVIKNWLSQNRDHRKMVAFVPCLDSPTEKKLCRMSVRVLHIHALGLNAAGPETLPAIPSLMGMLLAQPIATAGFAAVG